MAKRKLWGGPPPQAMPRTILAGIDAGELAAWIASHRLPPSRHTLHGFVVTGGARYACFRPKWDTPAQGEASWAWTKRSTDIVILGGAL